MKHTALLSALAATLTMTAPLVAAPGAATAQTSVRLSLPMATAGQAEIDRRGRGRDDGATDDRGGRGRGRDDRGADDHGGRGRGSDDGANHR